MSDTSAATPSFMDAVRAADTPGTPPVADAAPVGGTPAADTLGTPPQPNAAPPAPEWWKELGEGYKSADDVKQALSGLDGLRANQLTDDQKAVLALVQDPEKRSEFIALTGTDYTKLDDEAVLLDAFRAERPGMGEDEVLRLFHRAQDQRFPGLAGGEDDPDFRADAAERKREADKLREAGTARREARLDALKKGALPATADAAQGQEQAREQHLDLVKNTVSGLTDGYKFTVDVGGQPFNLAVEASELPAVQAVMENPLAALLKEDKSGLDPQKLLRFAVMQAHGDKLLAAAIQAGQQGAGVQLPLDELHNPLGTPQPAVAGQGTGSFADQVSKAFGPAAKPRY